MRETEICAIGLDIGGTKIAAGIVQFPSGIVLSKRIIPTEATEGGQHVLGLCLGLTDELVQEAEASGRHIAGIGIGIAEMVDLQGNVVSAQTIDWRNIDAPQYFRRWAPAVVDSDARAAALAEAIFGNGRAYRNFIYITVGTV